MTIFVHDFDNNGKSECIINWYPSLDSISYPFSTRQELITQLPGLKKQILKYENYAGKSFETLFPLEVRSKALRSKAEYLQSAVLWNNNGTMELEALPLEAQLSPVFGIVADDLDGDGKTDIWLGGNFYSLKPQVGRLNASKGVFLKGMGRKSFSYISPKAAGINVEGEVRDAGVIETKRSKHLIVARNNASVLLFEKRKK